LENGEETEDLHHTQLLLMNDAQQDMRKSKMYRYVKVTFRLLTGGLSTVLSLSFEIPGILLFKQVAFSAVDVRGSAEKWW
jgi:hypothetical protein